MSAPIIWIIIPFLIGSILWIIPNQRIVNWLGIGTSALFALSAWILPIEIPITVGNWTIKISSTLSVLGRYLIISPSDQPLLIFLYLSLCFYFSTISLSGFENRYTHYGFLILSLLISALAVEPFLYAALLIEIAVLVSIPLLKPIHILPGRGLLRFLAFQTIAMPFLLFSGWMLTGITSGSEQLSLTNQAATFLALGFVFLLAIFPFNTWVPLLVEESQPSSAVFILWIFPTIGLLFGLYFLDTYAWIRESSYISVILRSSGLLMVVTGGIWAAFQKNLRRIIAYAIIMETGYSLIALSIKGTIGVDLFFGLLVPRTVAIFIWSLALSIILRNTSSAQFSSVKGYGRRFPFSTAVIIFSLLSMTGVPLLAGFPFHQALWEQLGIISMSGAIWYAIGSIGLFMGGIRSLAVLVSPSNEKFIVKENLPQRIYLSFGILMLISFGIFPQWIAPFLAKFPLMFSHLGR